MRNDEIAEAQKLEAIELRKKQEIERKKAQMKLKKQEMIDAHQKLTSWGIAKDVLKPIKDDTVNLLNKQGVMHGEKEHNLVSVIHPWLIDTVSDILKGENTHESTIDDTIVEMFERDRDNHAADILSEADRIKEKWADESWAEKKWIEDKLKRKADRAARRKAAELQKLKNEMEKLFIEPGTEAEFVLGCELAEVHGNHTGNPIMGAVGGPLGQIFIVLSVFKSLNIEGTDKFWKKRQLLSFLCAYVA